MTYREAIINSLNPAGGELMPLRFNYFLVNMAIILITDSEFRLSMDVPDVTGGFFLGAYSGKAKPATATNIREVLNGVDGIRHIRQYMQFTGFLQWLMDQEAQETTVSEPNEDGGWESWYDLIPIGEKWNQYAAQAEKRRAEQ